MKDFFDNNNAAENRLKLQINCLFDETLKSKKGIRSVAGIMAFNERRRAGKGEQTEAKKRKPRRKIIPEAGTLRAKVGRKKLTPKSSNSETPF
jgi:hypothetical protein